MSRLPSCGPKSWKQSPKVKRSQRSFDSEDEEDSPTSRTPKKKKKADSGRKSLSRATKEMSIEILKERKKSASTKKKTSNTSKRGSGNGSGGGGASSSTSNRQEVDEDEFEDLGNLLDFCVPENLLGTEGKEGATYRVTLPSGKQLAMKTFRKTAAASGINKQAEFQRKAVGKGVSPKVYKVSGKDKYILMDKMDQRLVDLARNAQNSELTVSQQEQIMEIMDTLDECKILHNDGNILNLMVNADGHVKIIDFGLSSKIDKKREKKHGPHPNTKCTLYMMNISFKRYKIRAPLLVTRVEEYLSSRKK